MFWESRIIVGPNKSLRTDRHGLKLLKNKFAELYVSVIVVNKLRIGN